MFQLPSPASSSGARQKSGTCISRNVIDELAKPAFSRQIGVAEEDPRQAQKALAGLAERAENSVEKIAKTTRTVIAQARRTLTEVRTPQQFHDLVEEVAGRMVVQRDGTITQQDEDQEKSGSEDGSKPDGSYVVAGAGFEPAASGL